MVPGQDHPLVQHYRLAFTRLFHFRVARHAARGGGGLVHVSIDQTELEGRGRAKDFLRTRGILDTRQLNHDAVSALTLNQRLGDAQLVHTVTQDINVLLNRVLTGFFQALIGHHRFQAVVTLRGNNQIAMARAEIRDSLVARRAVAEDDAQTVVVFFTHGRVRNAFVAQLAAQAIDVLFLQFA